jgi:phenylacetic acid degradation operon negative regulatory protein
MTGLLPTLEAGDPAGLADGFVTSAAVLRHLQADPLLPPALLPDDWPGAALRHEYDAYDAAYRAVLRAWFASAG